jgi:hypothetical protein
MTQVVNFEDERNHILGVFKNVLERDTTMSVEERREFGRPTLTVTLATGSTFRVSCGVTKHQVSVMCATVVDDMSVKHFYEFRCPRKTLPKIRKVALILSKKIRLFDLYQVMNS